MLSSLVLNIARLSVWLGLLMMIFVPLERLSPQNKQHVFRKEFSVDIAYFFLNSLLPQMLLVLPLSIAAWVVHRIEPSGLYAGVASLSVEVRLLLAIIVGEFGSYWGHRWMHEFPLLWRFHAIHHSPQEIDWLVNTRADKNYAAIFPWVDKLFGTLYLPKRRWPRKYGIDESFTSLTGQLLEPFAPTAQVRDVDRFKAPKKWEFNNVG